MCFAFVLEIHINIFNALYWRSGEVCGKRQKPKIVCLHLKSIRIRWCLLDDIKLCRVHKFHINFEICDIDWASATAATVATFKLPSINEADLASSPSIRCVDLCILGSLTIERAMHQINGIRDNRNYILSIVKVNFDRVGALPALLYDSTDTADFYGSQISNAHTNRQMV